MLKDVLKLGLASAAALAFTSAATLAQNKIEMKIAHFIVDQHPMSVWIKNWADKLAKDSGGRIDPKIFSNAQMGPPPAYYDLARTGQADVTWYLTGGTPGRFPVTELINLPYLVGSSEIGTKVLNDPELRAKYLEPEHKGVKVLVLFTHQPGQVHTVRKPIKSVEDMKGMRIRFTSPTVRDFISALGATPVGVTPTEQADQLQKGTIDGTFIDYGGAGIAFKLGGILKYTTEIYAYVTSFGLIMNPAYYDKLPPDLKKLIDDSVKGKEKEIGEGWDSIDGPGKKLLMDGGMQPFRLEAAEDAKFRKAAAELADKTVKELEAKNLPAGAAYAMMKALSEKHTKTSRNFWAP
jgi:TRAP-type C4-dicarboxylate transport system substrate-binding protein